MQVLLEFNGHPLFFEEPEKIIDCRKLDDLPKAFDQMESALADGLTLAGFLSYEAGYYFEERLRNLCPADPSFPLLQMGCYRSPVKRFRSSVKTAGGKITGYRNGLGLPEYGKDIEAIRREIRQGGVYQVTYCYKKYFSWSGQPAGIYRSLKKAQPVPFPSMILADGFSILSLSPELFFKKTGGNITTQPMKGTWPRGKNFVSDRIGLAKFRRDEKNLAENLMITDLMRNDLGKIGREIRVPKIFETAAYKVCHQMTSTVTAKIDRAIPLIELFGAIFPSGSVTGAPKLRAMEIIRSLERGPRNIYTGAIGMITPERDMSFSIPIRTLLLRGDQGEMGVGGGIVWDSTVEGEWEESRLKSAFLSGLAEK